MGAINFVPEQVQTYGKQIRFWGLVRKKKLGRRIGYRRLQLMAKSLCVEMPMANALEQIQSFLSYCHIQL